MRSVTYRLLWRGLRSPITSTPGSFSKSSRTLSALRFHISAIWQRLRQSNGKTLQGKQHKRGGPKPKRNSNPLPNEQAEMSDLRRSRFETISSLEFLFQVLKAVP